MRLLAVPIAIALSAPAAAETWTPAAGPDALAGRSVTYASGARQRFAASGATLHDAGAPSWGRWEMRGSDYCSTWPPADGWVCYALEVSDRGRVRFRDASGGATVGTIDE